MLPFEMLCLYDEDVGRNGLFQPVKRSTPQIVPACRARLQIALYKYRVLPALDSRRNAILIMRSINTTMTSTDGATVPHVLPRRAQCLKGLDAHSVANRRHTAARFADAGPEMNMGACNRYSRSTTSTLRGHANQMWKLRMGHNTMNDGAQVG